LAIRQRDLGDENPNTLNSMNALAALYREQGKYGDAEAMLLKGLEIRRRVLGETHPGIADSMACLAKLYAMQGNYAEAEGWYVKALETGRMSLRHDHPEMRWYRDELARVYLKHGSSLAESGDWKQAINIFTKAVELSPDLFGTVFVELKTKGKLAEAETPLRCALTFFEKRAAEFPEEARYQKCIADVQLRLGQAIGKSRPAESESCFRAAITIYENLVARVSPEGSTYRQDLGQSYRWLASSLDRTTKISEREQLWRQAAAQFEVLLNLDDGSSRSQYHRYALADTYRALADDVALQKRTVEAEAIYNQAQDQFTRVRAEQLTDSADNPIRRRQSLSASFKNLTNLLVAAGRTEEAVQVSEKAIAVYTKLAAESPDEAYFREELAKRQAELEQLEAKP
jgi:tetratricopeptide (TPR) repeat protein